MKERVEKLKTFIRENVLTFSDIGSSLNSECCTISGYALHIGTKSVGEIADAVKEVCGSTEDEEDYIDELKRVFEYAKSNDYGSWWADEEAKKMYIF